MGSRQSCSSLWHIVYHCNGKPVEYGASHKIFDGIDGGYLNSQINKNSYVREEIDKVTKRKIEESNQNDSGTFEIKPLGKGEFKWSNIGLSESGIIVPLQKPVS